MPPTEEYQALPVSYSDPVILTWSEASEPEFSTASGTYLHLGSRFMLATNAHVYREYERLRDIYGDARFRIGDNGLPDVDSRLIDIDDKSDLATIDLADVELSPRETSREALQTRRFFEPAAPWPAAVAQESDIVSFGGWPRVLRQDESDNRGAESNPYSITDVPVTGATLYDFRVRIDRANITYSFGRTQQDEDGSDFDFRGMSGAPVLRRRNGITELVGIVMEYLGRMLDGAVLVDTFIMTNAATIKTDGTLWHNTIR